jgi:hypothetical protein
LFHSIDDAQLRYKVLKTVEMMASGGSIPAEEPHR